MAGDPVRPKGLRLRLTSTAEAEFIAQFMEYCDDNSVFAPTERFLARGVPIAFSLELADGTPMLRGLGSVLDCWSTDDNRFGRPGVHIEFSQLTESSEVMLDRLLAARERANAKTVPRMGGRRRGAPLTQQQWGSDIAPATMQMEAQDEPSDSAEATAVGEAPRPNGKITRQRASVAPPNKSTNGDEPTAASTPRTITRERGAVAAPNAAAPVAITVGDSSGAPVAEIDEKTSQTSRYEGPMRTPAIPPKPSIPKPIGVPKTLAPPKPIAGLPALPPGATAQSEASAEPVRESAPALPPPPSAAIAVAAGPTPSAPIMDVARPTPPVAELARANAAETPAPPAPVIAAPLSPVFAPRAVSPATESLADGFDAELEAMRPPAPWWRNRRVGGVFAAGILLGVLTSMLFRSSPPAPARPVAAAAAPTVIERVAECAPEKAATIALAETPEPAATTPAKPAGPAKKALPPPTRVAVAATPKPTAQKPATGTTTKTAAITTKAPVATKSSPTATTKAPTKPTAVAKAAPKPATIATKPTTTATKPAAIATRTAPTTPSTKATTTKSAVAQPTKPGAVATTKPAAKPGVVAKSPQPTTTAKTTQPTATAKTTQPTAIAKTAPKTTAPATKPVVVAKSAPTKPTTISKAPAKPTPPKAAARKRGCTTLDCI